MRGVRKMATWWRGGSPRLTIADIDVRVSTGLNLRGTNLMGLDLDEVHVCLDGIDFTGACMIGTTIACQILSNSNLTNVDMRNASLVKADLQGANLRGATLQGANLHGADFYDVRLNSAILAFANLRGAKNIFPPFGSRGNDLSDILLCQTILPNGIIFPGPYLTTGYRNDFPEQYR